MAQGQVKSAKRVFEVLEYFRQTRGALRLRDIVEHLGYPSSSTAELLKGMAELGYLCFDPHKRSYFPTPRLTALGDWISDATFDSGRVIDLMRQLNERTGELVMLGVANGLHVQYIQVIQSIHPVRYVVEPGTRRPLVSSGAGWALLSNEKDSAIEKIWRRTLARDIVTRQAVPIEALMDKVNLVRSLGFVYARGQVLPEASSIAAPVPQAQNGQRFSMSLGGPTERFDRKLDSLAQTLKSGLEPTA